MAQLGSTIVNGSLRVTGDVYADNVMQTYTGDDNPTTTTASTAKNGDVWVGGANSGTDVKEVNNIQYLMNTVTDYTLSSTGWVAAKDGDVAVVVQTVTFSISYNARPDVWFNGSTDAEKLAYSKLYKVTIDTDAKALKFYAVSTPSANFPVSVRGVK